jgi:heme oxygenase
MSLKDLIKSKHAAAEGTAFMKAVFAKTLPMDLWEDYTLQKAIWYRAIEQQAASTGLLDQLPGIARGSLILDDYRAMIGNEPRFHTPREVSKEYAIYINDLDDRDKILAHLYTWHMGDMFGGQMIKRLIPAASSHLEFEDVAGLIAKLRPMLTDELADEANVAFDWAIRILSEYDASLG